MNYSRQMMSRKEGRTIGGKELADEILSAVASNEAEHLSEIKQKELICDIFLNALKKIQGEDLAQHLVFPVIDMEKRELKVTFLFTLAKRKDKKEKLPQCTKQLISEKEMNYLRKISDKAYSVFITERFHQSALCDTHEEHRKS